MFRPLSLLILSFFFFSCSPEKKEITLSLDWLPNPNHVPLYVGLEKGFFEEEGIFLEIKVLSDPSDTVSFVQSGVSDLALYYLSDYLRAKEKGVHIDLVSVFIEQPLNAFIFRTGEGILKKEDFNDKVIGFSQDGYNEVFLREILRQNKIVPKELKNVSFDLVGTLGTKSVDIIVDAYWNIESEHLRSFGIETQHFPLADFGVPPYHEIIVITKEKGKLDTSEFKESFQRALQKSIQFSQSHPKEAFEIYVQKNPDKSEKTLLWEEKSWALTAPLFPEKAEPSEIVIENYKEWMRKSLESSK